MKIMTFLMSVLLFSMAQASPTKTLVYDGQNGDTLQLEELVKVTRYRTEERDSTCTRQIPYTKEVCGDVTRYRNECTWEPGREHCRTDYQRVCRQQTDYRQRCTTSPGRRVCRHKPGGKTCRQVNGQMRCRQTPGRQVCSTKPGHRTCRREPYRRTVCSNQPRRRCEYQPGRNICRDIPYSEYVCQDKTFYREEQYACKKPVQVPYQAEKKIIANLDFNFSEKALRSKVRFYFKLNTDGSISFNFKDLSSSPRFISVKKTLDQHDTGDELIINGQYKFSFIDKNKTLSPITKEIQDISLSEKYIQFTIGKLFHQSDFNISVDMTRKQKFSGSKVTVLKGNFSSDKLNFQTAGDKTLVKLNIKKLGVPLKGDRFNIKLKTAISLDKNIINKENIKTSRSTSVNIKKD